MSDEPEERPEYRLAIPRDRLEDLIERRAQAARRRKLILRRLTAACLVAACVGVAGAMIAMRPIPLGDESQPREAAAPADEWTASAMTTETSGLQTITDPGDRPADGAAEARAPDSYRVAPARRSPGGESLPSAAVVHADRERRGKVEREASARLAESRGRLDPAARARPAVRTRRAFTCERLEQELARCAESAAPASFGRRAMPTVGSQAP